MPPEKECWKVEKWEWNKIAYIVGVQEELMSGIRYAMKKE
jgi:hypothetical protein